MKIQKPSPGRVVYFARAPDLTHPLLVYNFVAVIITVIDNKGTVNLRCLNTLERFDNISHCAKAKTNTWHYPPRVEGEIEVAE